MIKIFLVEDEPLWQAGIENLIAMETDMQLVGVSDNYDDAIVTYQQVNPQVVLVDWKILGEKDGLMVAQTLVEKGHSPQCVVVVSGSERSLLPPFPYPFVPKPQIASQLVPTIRKMSL